MIRGLTTAASGMLADERLQQMLANNLANLETPGFKASDGALLAFPEQLLMRLHYGDATGPVIGKAGTGVVFQEGVPRFSEGSVTATGRALDVAILDTTPAGTYAAVQTTGAAATPAGQTGAGAGQAGTGATGVAAGQTGAGQPVAIASVLGPVAVGPGGRLTAGGLPLAVLDAAGQAIPGIYAVRNPAYQGSGLVAADGKPDYDAAGQPSYLFADANGRIVGRPGDAAWQGAALRIGSDVDMGDHSFFAVAYSSSEVPAGVALTRDGHLSLNSRNELVDAAGHPILPVGPNGLPLPQARIVVNPAYQGHDLFAQNGDPVYDQHGQPSYRVVGPGGQAVPGARLGLVDADVTRLVPLGETEFMVGGTLNPQQVVAALRPGTGRLAPGKLEQSNVDPAATMTRMLAVIAQYQANQEVIRAEDETLAKAVQDVGHVNA